MSNHRGQNYIFGNYNHYGVMPCGLFPSVKTLLAYRSFRRPVRGGTGNIDIPLIYRGETGDVICQKCPGNEFTFHIESPDTLIA